MTQMTLWKKIAVWLTYGVWITEDLVDEVVRKAKCTWKKKYNFDWFTKGVPVWSNGKLYIVLRVPERQHKALVYNYYNVIFVVILENSLPAHEVVNRIR